MGKRRGEQGQQDDGKKYHLGTGHPAGALARLYLIAGSACFFSQPQGQSQQVVGQAGADVKTRKLSVVDRYQGSRQYAQGIQAGVQKLPNRV